MFFALPQSTRIAKYLDEIFLDPHKPEIFILSPDTPDTDQTGPMSGPGNSVQTAYTDFDVNSTIVG